MKTLLSIFLIGTFVLFNYVSIAQQNCSNPHVINSLPFNATGLSTTGMLNDYGPADACNSTAMENEDYVFSFTPSSDMQINVVLSNTSIQTESFLPIANIGLFITDLCPDDTLANCVAFVDNVTANPSLNDISVTAGTTYYIIVSSANAMLGGETNVNFDIEVTKNSNLDIAVTNIIVNPSSCSLTQSPISVEIVNLGIQTVTSFEISYFLNAILIGTDPITLGTPIEQGDTTIIDLSNTLNFPSIGNYEILVNLNLTGDENTDNNTMTIYRTRVPFYDTEPFVEDFSAGNGFWFTSDEGSSWEYGTPIGTVINNAGIYGSQCWITNAAGSPNLNENSFIQSPCYDLSDFSLPTIDISVWTDFAIFGNSASLTASIDGGSNFDIELYQWTGTTSGWTMFSFTAEQLIGASNVIFRLNYIGGILNGEGIALNYFEVHEAVLNDVGVTAILKPFTSCGMSDSEIVTIEITNYGFAPQTDISVGFSLDGINYTEETVPGTINSGDTITYTFTQTIDLSTIGDYTIFAKTNNLNDENNENDEISVNVISQENIQITDIYEESFETGNGGWYAYGENSSLELGTPAGITIINAADGNNAWVTNLDGNANLTEISYLESPCFDFTNMVNPVFKAAINYNTTMFLSNFYLEYTTDGIYWDTINAGDVNENWYGTDIITIGTWSGVSNGWIYAKTNLPQLANEPFVKFRFVYNAGALALQEVEGIGIDMIEIYECDVFPEAYFTYSTTIDGMTVQFQNESENADTYLWNFGDNDILPSTSTEVNPIFTYTAEGSYYVSLTASNDCSSSTYGVYIDITLNDCKEFEIEGINIYPNPASNYIILSGLDNKTIEILDIKGDIIKSLSTNSDEFILDINNFQNGIYFIKTENEGKPILIKFIKE